LIGGVAQVVERLLCNTRALSAKLQSQLHTQKEIGEGEGGGEGGPNNVYTCEYVYKNDKTKQNLVNCILHENKDSVGFT
jgi:hypothetical protein